jgi:formylmethanofuran dehydrogenase subunit C
MGAKITPQTKNFKPNSKANFDFRHYAPESEKKIGNLVVKEDKTLKQLKEVFRNYKYPPSTVRENSRAVSLIADINYSSKDITKLSIALAEFQDEKYFSEKASMLLSSLINSSKENNFTIITEHLARRIDKLGDHNTKNIIIQGDAGDRVGYWMEGGTITVKGNAGDSVGMGMKDGIITIQGNARDAVGWGTKGGTITVHGDAREGVGRFTQGGRITIKGNAGKGVGREMSNGTVYLEGEYGSLDADIRGGNIFHKGKQIVKNGKRPLWFVMKNLRANLKKKK